MESRNAFGGQTEGTAEKRRLSGEVIGSGQIRTDGRDDQGVAVQRGEIERPEKRGHSSDSQLNPEGRAGALRIGVPAKFVEGGRRLGGELPPPDELTGNNTVSRAHGMNLAIIPEGVRATAAPRRGEYDARRLRSQRELIRDVMLAAADCGTWLTLGELRALTCYGEASISAQLRHLRKTENGGFEVVKRHRDVGPPERTQSAPHPRRAMTTSQARFPRVDGRGECVWEYRISGRARATDLDRGATAATAGA
jgi:hypothetical protein